MINKYKQIFKRVLFLLLSIIIFAPIFLLVYMQAHKNTNPSVVYLENKFKHPNRNFIMQAFAEIPKATPEQVALIMAADIAEGDIILPLERGYNLIAFDTQMIYYDFNIPSNLQNRDKITIVTNLDFAVLPNLDLVMASYILPFYSQGDFQKVWHDIDTKIKPGGYFVGNFFDPSSNIFNGKQIENMSFHTKEQVFALFKNYEILKFAEVSKNLENHNGIEHYYEVLARKNTTACAEFFTR